MLRWAHHSFGLSEWDSESIYLPSSMLKEKKLRKKKLWFLVKVKLRNKKVLYFFNLD